MDLKTYEAKINDMIDKAAKELDVMDYHALLGSIESDCEMKREALEAEHDIA